MLKIEGTLSPTVLQFEQFSHHVLCPVAITVTSLSLFSDCRTFTLAEYRNRYVVDTANNTANYMSRGECFIWCFDVQGCLTFFHDDNSNICQLYTSCGTSCNTAVSISSNHRVYTRHCEDGMCFFYKGKFYLSWFLLWNYATIFRLINGGYLLWPSFWVS